MFKILKRSYKNITKLNVLQSSNILNVNQKYNIPKITFMLRAKKDLFKDNELKYLFLISMVMFL